MESGKMQFVYEDQFRRYLLIAKSFVGRLKKIQDRKICKHWIRRVSSLGPCSITVGRNRNIFFQYLLQVIQEAVLEDMLKDYPDHILWNFQHIPIQGLRIVEDPAWLDRELDVPEFQDNAEDCKEPYFAHWSNDQRTYIAAKALPGKGALIYMAVSHDPSLGWSNLAD
ncbi:Centrosomal protein of 112 kDa [Frankliniella fusca]|uniref:Centrosomal protein of 112 kDa n=1 Tax=Frankliniella fusca TaxID=407009 RepID=A0AAE1L7V3_9NEOP|nr:Centrosomal protein of 112 kDa [Frankliniella fusca]